MSIYLITHVKDDGSEEPVGYCKSYYEAARVEGYLIGTDVYGPDAVFSIEEVFLTSIDFWKKHNMLLEKCRMYDEDQSKKIIKN